MRGEAYYGPLTDRERFKKRLRDRFLPPRNPHFNRFQRVIWRLQRLVLGDNRARRARKGTR